MKRLIVRCDGTWQQLTSPYQSNVLKLAQAVKPIANDGILQIVFYDQGIGTESDKLLGGVTRLGLDQNIQHAYRFLCLIRQVFILIMRLILRTSPGSSNWEESSSARWTMSLKIFMKAYSIVGGAEKTTALRI